MNFDAAAHAAAPPYPDAPQLPHLSRRLRLQYEAAQTRWVLLYPEGMVQLNETAAAILGFCDGQRSVIGVIADLENEYEADDLREDVLTFLHEAVERGWVRYA